MLESMAISLLEAIRNGDQNTAKWILRHKRYSNLDKQSSKKDGTALFWCCCKGYIELVKLLLLHGADINKCTAWGATPLHASADHNNVDILVLLIECGANVNQQTKNGDTACHLAAYRGYKACVERLAERGASVEIRNNKSQTPIQEAYARGHYDIYAYLLNVQTLVKKPKQPTKECTYSSTVVKRMPAPPPTEYYSCPSSQDAGVNYPMGNFHGNTCSLPSDYSVLSESNSNIPVPYMGEMKNNVIGVLRVNCNSLDLSRSDYVSDISSCSSVDSCSNVLNDLSSVDTSVVPSVPSNSMLSFKNI